jgi:hypothetical protein
VKLKWKSTAPATSQGQVCSQNAAALASPSNRDVTVMALGVIGV